MKKSSGEIDGYKWTAFVDKSCGGWSQTYYRVEAPDGELFCDGFTSGPLEDGISACKTAIEDHKNGDY